MINLNLQKFSEFMQYCRNDYNTIHIEESCYNSDIIERFKKGNKIKIKKKNRGKFTDYCNGKVTSECIERGKNSPDPKIRKRATFAQSARSWNHK